MAKKDLNLSVPTKKPTKKLTKKPVKTETQLDRIERKLDELLTRPVPAIGYVRDIPDPRPVPSPYAPSWPYSQTPRTPTDVWGNPVVYCSACQQRGVANA